MKRMVKISTLMVALYCASSLAADELLVNAIPPKPELLSVPKEEQKPRVVEVSEDDLDRMSCAIARIRYPDIDFSALCKFPERKDK